MADPVLAADLAELRSDFDDTFPTRDHGTDGWIGDTAHQEHTSGHNPDDTPGSLAEYSDSDTKPEVRAVDVDKDLNDPNVTMYDVIKKIIATVADARRLKYIIHAPVNGPLGANVPTQWKKSTNWKPERYTGDNPHDKHAHFSGDPNYDEDKSPWSSVRSFGMSWTDKVPPGSTDNDNRTYGACLTDVENIRNWDVASPTKAPGPGAPPAGSRLFLLHERVEKLDGWAADTTQQLDRIEALLQQLVDGATPLPTNPKNITGTFTGTITEE